MDQTAPEAQAASAARDRQRRLNVYLVGQATWFASLGIQFVLFPYLVTNVLDVPPFLVGVAQMSLMAPSIVFMMFGGALADQTDVRRILIAVHFLAFVPPLVLAAILLSGQLTYGILIAYAVCMGTLGAFVIPARDSGLTRIAGTGIQQAVMLAMMAQFVAQIAGMIIAAIGSVIGAPHLLVVQSVIMAVGAVAAIRLPLLPTEHHNRGDGTIKRIADGFRMAAHVKPILPVIGLMFCVGIFYVGSFMVIIPINVRDTYQGGMVDFSILNTCFWGGTIAATLFFLRVGHVRYRGRAMIFALTSGVCVIAAFSMSMPFWLFGFLCFIWGCGAGTTMNMSRTIVQMAAPDSHRARILAFYQLGFSGGGPIGSLTMGFLVGQLGLRTAPLVPFLMMTGILIAVVLFTSLWSYETAEA